MNKNPCLFQIDGKTYVGQGLSMPFARQDAAENALKSLLLEKMAAAVARLDDESYGEATDANAAVDKTADELDEIPWSSLANFALYKLILEWQNQGTDVPIPGPFQGVFPGNVKNELPLNAITIHPVILLNQMRPGLTYIETNRVGNPPNTMFTLAVEIDDVDYSGTGM